MFLGGVVVEIDYPQCIGDSDKIRIYKLTNPDSVTRAGILHILRNKIFCERKKYRHQKH